MSDHRETPEQQQARELAEERELHARAHKHMGMAAAILGLVAVFVALARMRAIFGVSPWEALRLGASAMPWVLLILGLGVLFSLGASRMMLGLEWLVKRITGRQVGR